MKRLSFTTYICFREKRSLFQRANRCKKGRGICAKNLAIFPNTIFVDIIPSINNKLLYKNDKTFEFGMELRNFWTIFMTFPTLKENEIKQILRSAQRLSRLKTKILIKFKALPFTSITYLAVQE